VCQIVAVLPSSTLAAAPFSRTVSWLSAATVQPVRGSAGSVPPSRLISAAADQVPRSPASLSAVSRTKRVSTVANVTVLSTSSSANVPVAATVYVVPSLLASTRYCPIRPFGPSAGGR
jgi:hypothetical protein